MAVVGVLAAGAIGLSSAALAETSAAAPSSTSGLHFAAAAAAGRTGARLLAANGGPLTSGSTITVTGSGSVEGRPDTVSFELGVHTTAATATGALDANNASVASLESTLENHGVAQKGMQTANLSVYTNTDKAGIVTGFSVDDDLEVSMPNGSAVGEALDAGAQAVGNGIQFDGISFSISNESALLARARANAMTSAKTEAMQVAAGAGLQLGPVERVTDDENTSQPPVLYGGATFGAAEAAVPLESGRQALSVRVSVVYELRS